LGVLLLAACLPSPTDLVGKECDPTHECGRGLFCVAGRCAVEPAASGTAGGGSAGTAGGSAGAGSAGGVATAGGAGTAGGMASACDAGAAETDCSNGRDDDCDGLVDCADPSCVTLRCDAANPAAVCCGTGLAAGCRDLSADPKNCGMCGGSCRAGEMCRGVSTGGIVTGRCSCRGDAECNFPGRDDQSCVATHCSCNDDDECAAGQRCVVVSSGQSSTGACHYAP
jgi:hypothetical protein